MSWDTVNHNRRTEWFQDHDLWTLRSFLVAAATDLLAGNPGDRALTAAAQFFAGWQYGYGAVTGTEFERPPDADLSAALVRVVDGAVRRVRAYGRLIPVRELGELVRAPYDPGQPFGVYLRPESVRMLVGQLARLRCLWASRPAEPAAAPDPAAR